MCTVKYLPYLSTCLCECLFQDEETDLIVSGEDSSGKVGAESGVTDSTEDDSSPESQPQRTNDLVLNRQYLSTLFKFLFIR